MENNFLRTQNDLVAKDNALLLNEMDAVGSLLQAVLHLAVPTASKQEIRDAQVALTEIGEDFQTPEVLASYIVGVLDRQHLSLPLKAGELASVSAQVTADCIALRSRIFDVPTVGRPTCTKRLAVDREKMMARLVDVPVEPTKEDDNG